MINPMTASMVILTQHRHRGLFVRPDGKQFALEGGSLSGKAWSSLIKIGKVGVWPLPSDAEVTGT